MKGFFMDRTGKYFDVTLKNIHLKWGTTGMTDGHPRDRSNLEAYIPIPIHVAEELNLSRRLCFNVSNTDFQVHASGSQGKKLEFGKNFSSVGDLKPLGKFLKGQLHLQPGNRVRVKWVSPDTVEIKKV